MNKILQQPILLLWFRVPAKLLFEPTDVPSGHAKGFGDGVRLLPCFQTGQDTSFERFTTAQVGHDDLHPPKFCSAAIRCRPSNSRRKPVGFRGIKYERPPHCAQRMTAPTSPMASDSSNWLTHTSLMSTNLVFPKP